MQIFIPTSVSTLNTHTHANTYKYSTAVTVNSLRIQHTTDIWYKVNSEDKTKEKEEINQHIVNIILLVRANDHMRKRVGVGAVFVEYSLMFQFFLSLLIYLSLHSASYFQFLFKKKNTSVCVRLMFQ